MNRNKFPKDDVTSSLVEEGTSSTNTTTTTSNSFEEVNKALLDKTSMKLDRLNREASEYSITKRKYDKVAMFLPIGLLGGLLIPAIVAIAMDLDCLLDVSVCLILLGLLINITVISLLVNKLNSKYNEVLTYAMLNVPFNIAVKLDNSDVIKVINSCQERNMKFYKLSNLLNILLLSIVSFCVVLGESLIIGADFSSTAGKGLYIAGILIMIIGTLAMGITYITLILINNKNNKIALEQDQENISILLKTDFTSSEEEVETEVSTSEESK